MWPQASSLLVFLGGIGLAFSIPTSYGHFDPDRLTEDVYRLRGFADSNPVDIAGLKAWDSVLEGFEKLAPMAERSRFSPHLPQYHEIIGDPEELPDLKDLSDLKDLEDITKLFPASDFELLKENLKMKKADSPKTR